MKLTLVTVSYNSSDTLRETIQSVRDQGLPNLEYLIIDGGSEDDTISVIEENRDVVTRWISEPDMGIYDGINKGIRMATGDVVGFLHADDRFAADDILKQVVQAFENNPIDFLYGDLEYVTSFSPKRVVRYWESGRFSPSKLRRGWMPPHPTVYFKKELVERIGFFNIDLSISSDYDWMLRCLQIRDLRVYYLHRVMVQMGMGGISNRNISSIIRKSLEDYRAIRNNKMGGIATLVLKNIRKLPQFFRKNA